MEAAKKSFELQSQIRHNAEDFKNTINELFSWEKEIKDKEAALKRRSSKEEEEASKDQEGVTPPVRSHVENVAGKTNGQPAAAAPIANKNAKNLEAQKSVEQINKNNEANAAKRKQAHGIKERGNKHVKLGDYERAIQEYSAAIEVFAEDPAFYNNRALCFLKMEKYDECIEDCERAIELDSLAVKAYYRRMQANESLGNNMDALKDCTTILMIEPKNAEAKKSLERINQRLRKQAAKTQGPSFTADRKDLVTILPFDKPPYKRSTKPLRRMPITDVVGPKDTKNYENSNMQVSDEMIDKLFNSDCGPFEEIKKKPSSSANTTEKPNVIATEIAKPKNVTKQTIDNKLNIDTKIQTNDTKKVTNEIKKQTNEIKKPTNEIKNQINESKKETIDTKKEFNEMKKDSIEAKQTALRLAAEIAKQLESNKHSTENTQNAPIDSNKLAPKSVKEKPVTTAAEVPVKSTELLSSTTSRPMPPAPVSTAQFYSNWKELSAAQKYTYLKSIEVSKLGKILGAGFDSDTLTAVIYTLHDYYLPNKEPNLAATLLEVSKNNQVAILSLLMSTDERKVITEILNALKEREENAAVAATIAKNFNIVKN